MIKIPGLARIQMFVKNVAFQSTYVTGPIFSSSGLSSYDASNGCYELYNQSM